MDKEPKGGFPPIAISAGAHMVCCLGLVFFATSGIPIGGWLGGIDPLLPAGIAVAIFLVIVLFRQMRKPASAETRQASPTTTLKEGK